MRLCSQTLSVGNACVTIKRHLSSIIQIKAPESECVKFHRENEATFPQSTCYKWLFPLSSKESYVMLEQLENPSPPEIR
jgi:hypothetical protein